MVQPCLMLSHMPAFRIEPETQTIIHSAPFCLPESFRPVEEEWVTHDYQDASYWISHAPESINAMSIEKGKDVWAVSWVQTIMWVLC